MCQKHNSALNCLSTGECKICKFVDATDKYEGCDISSATPICDGDSATASVDLVYSNASKTPGCKACKTLGKSKFIAHIRTVKYDDHICVGV